VTCETHIFGYGRTDLQGKIDKQPNPKRWGHEEYFCLIIILTILFLWIHSVRLGMRLDEVMCGDVDALARGLHLRRERCHAVTQVCHDPRLVERDPELHLQNRRLLIHRRIPTTKQLSFIINYMLRLLHVNLPWVYAMLLILNSC